METLKNLSGTQKFIIGLIFGLVLGWGGTYLGANQSGGSKWKCGAGESLDDCIARLEVTRDAGNSMEEDDESMSDANGDAMKDTMVDTPAGVSVPGTNAVAVEDQLAGNTVEVTMVTLSAAGWVVIHEDNNGVPGRVLGAHRYDPGLYLAEVELLRDTEVGNTYYAMLHTDDGDKQFDLSKDLPMLGADGKVIMDSFVAR